MLGVLTYLLYLLSKPDIPKGMYNLWIRIPANRKCGCKGTQNI